MAHKFLLDGLVYKESCTECRLLRNLLGLNGMRELGTERDVRDRNVVEDNVELLCASDERLANELFIPVKYESGAAENE